MQLILLADDNGTNRKVMQEQLRLLGYASEVAIDGVEAMQMLHDRHYSLLLTDCNMPNMDGFELAEAIREAEPEGKHLPIIAVTANSLKSEVQRCFESGMDDFLSKPLRINELAPMLLKWLPLEGNSDDEPISNIQLQNVVVNNSRFSIAISGQPIAPVNETDVVIWNATTLSRLLGDNPDLERSVLEDFLVSAKALLDSLAEAISTGDALAAGKVAHKLKSASRTVGALRLGELCQEMETAGGTGDIQACGTAIDHLKNTYAESVKSITQHLNS